MKRKQPTTRIRPFLGVEIGNRLWHYCNDHGLIINAVADQAIREWLDRQQEEESAAA